jgi:hypothetical protein
VIVSDSERDPVDRRLNPVASLWDVGGAHADPAVAAPHEVPHLTSITFDDPKPVLFSPMRGTPSSGVNGTTALWCR